MNSKGVWIFVVCMLANFVALAQQQYFKMPEGLTADDYEAGVVWVKVKPEYKAILESPQSNARLSSQIRATKVKSFAPHSSKNKSISRVAPRKLHVDMSQYFKINYEKTYSL